jgi:hypothetical protein
MKLNKELPMAGGMMRSIFIPLFISVLILPLTSHSKKEVDIGNIQKLYHETKKKISSDQLYCNEFILNRDKLPVSAVGNYQETLQFYYTSSHMPGIFELKMIIVEGEHSITRTHAEFLFNSENELIFYHYRFHDGQGYTTQNRCYFKDKRLIRLIDNDDIIDDTGKKYNQYRDAIIKRSKKFQSFFSECKGFSLFEIEDLKK